MSVSEFIQKMPKAELRLRLEGIFRKDTLLMIAEQNEIRATVKKFDDWVTRLDEPDGSKIDETVQFVSQWLQAPDDLSRIVYDLGVILSKQNVKYVEVIVNPVLFMQSGMTFDEFMGVINDGRDRAERGWGIRINWLLNIPWDEPRRADDTVRWATNASGKKAGIVGIILSGDDSTQPVGQFARAFTNAKKKFLPTAAFVGQKLGAEGVGEVIQELEPTRLVDARGVESESDIIEKIVSNNISVDVCLARGVKLGWYKSYAEHPIKRLYDENVKLTLSSDMPSYYGTSITDEYEHLVNEVGLTIEELEEIALNAVRFSFLPDEDKEAMLNDFQQEYARLKDELIVSKSETIT
ncbi:MAG: hypothetical protein RLP44_03025 [Aggregatilineales bacterium]